MLFRSTTTPSTAVILNQPPKRNKRKNFEPRNIALYAGEDNEVSDKNREVVEVEECDSDLEMVVDDNDAENERIIHKPLDLSENSIPPSSPPQEKLESGSNIKRSRKPVPLRRFHQSNLSSGELMSSAGAPMDLSCSRNENNDESCGEECDDQNNSDSGSGGCDESSENRHHHRQSVLQHIQNSLNESGTFGSERSYLQRHYSESNGTSYHHTNNHHSQPASVHRSDGRQYTPLSSLQQAAHSLGFHHFPAGLTPEQLSHYHHHLPHHHHHGTDASAMKEYAENTMKELLSIYGLNSPDMAETITKNVPLDSFASGEYIYQLHGNLRNIFSYHLSANFKVYNIN